MKYDGTDLSLLSGLAFLSGFCIAFWLMVMICDSRMIELREEAVKRGAAEWVAVPEKQSEFRWKPVETVPTSE